MGDGERSHLFYMLHECQNCEFKAEVKINHGGNSGMYFRAKFGPEWPAGYEAQVNNTHSDWRRTGSLYHFRGYQGAAHSRRHLVDAGRDRQRQSHHH